MRHIGRIITTTKLEGLSDFIEVTKDSSSIKDNEAKIPTLIIGHKNAENICGGDVKMLNKRIGDNLYWTFSKRERRIEYEPDLDNFMKVVSDFLLKFCKYEYIDPITWDTEKQANFLEIITNNKKKVLYLTDSMYYIYYPKENKVYGLSSEILKYLDLEDSINESFSKESTIVVHDSDFFDGKIAKSKFVQPILYYLRSF